ncbi:hypothetical protein NS365_20705 [Aureimonas ureilytica]|uniref:Uncharacterized protein n=2 Tax=Aurantimonadaceae TaxID=255475 RepID=A0A175R678_9HYPH|nr:hypothetical protein NS226_19170 [Aureimonas ureilytica]KTR02678.1 hypothetical protein NS365_20705 [Aureimonas ureilytica]
MIVFGTEGPIAMRTPNYNFERQERDKAKAAKKAEKAAAKKAKSGSAANLNDESETLPETSSSSAS